MSLASVDYPLTSLDKIQETRFAKIQGTVFFVKTIFKDDCVGKHIEVYDKKSSINIDLFPNDKISEEDIEKTTLSSCVEVEGEVHMLEDDFSLDPISFRLLEKPKEKEDTYPEKRIEFSIHTKKSQQTSFSTFDEYAFYAHLWNHKALAITDVGTVASYKDAYKAGKKYGLKIIYGLETEFIDEDRGIIIPVVLYAKNKKGLHYLYELVSMEKTHMSFDHGQSTITKGLLKTMKDALLICSSPACLDVNEYLQNDLPDAKAKDRLSFYDVIALSPFENYKNYIKPSLVNEYEEPTLLYERYLRLIKSLGKPAILVSDARYATLDKKEISHVYDFGVYSPDYSLKTTDEMINALSFIQDKNLVEDVVIHNPAKVASLIEDDLHPFDDVFVEPQAKGYEAKLDEILLKKAQEEYGNPLPDFVRTRLDKEKASLTETKNLISLYFAYQLTELFRDNGTRIQAKGGFTNSFIAYLLGFNEINPLKPAFVCKDCKTTILASKDDGVTKQCPTCQKTLIKQGYPLPFMPIYDKDESSLILNLAVPTRCDQVAMQEFKDLVLAQKNNVYKSGKEATISLEEATMRVRQYFALENNDHPRQSEVHRLALGFLGIHDDDSDNPSQMIIVPSSMNLMNLTPLQYPKKSPFPWMCSHLDYEDFKENLMAFEIEGDDNMAWLEEALAKASISSVSDLDKMLSEKDIYSLFTSPDSLSLKDNVLKQTNGVLGLPYLGTLEGYKLLSKVQVTNFDDLVRVLGLLLGEGTYRDNAKTLLFEKHWALEDVVTNREDLYTDLLLKYHFEEKESLHLLSVIANGQLEIGSKEAKDLEEHGVSRTLLVSLLKIKKLYHKGELAFYAKQVLRFGYLKCFYPTAFYCTYFDCKPYLFDFESIQKGKEACVEAMNNYIDKPIDYHNDSLVECLGVCAELLDRGFFISEEPSNEDFFTTKDDKKTIVATNHAFFEDVKKYRKKEGE